ncbi:hypothetical protein [Pseudoduganella violacea]|uniref:Uncharacterized protein n=1 Tax=Pseudoduganella violacea TaxID=1715466 RepID=A0A7W5BC20_9BURK|nr:hypothetical protein [Pseudoduganella violacea]MBB3120404.1 hypothetical protein [Pseudoduganella violacea]
MKTAILVLASTFAGFASAGQLSCPQFAPADWGIGQKALESVRVMSYPAQDLPGPDREYYATPPWEEREKAGFIYQIWHLEKVVGFKHEVDCVYAGTDRYLSLELANARRCAARWRARRDHGVVPYSLNFWCK